MNAIGGFSARLNGFRPGHPAKMSSRQKQETQSFGLSDDQYARGDGPAPFAPRALPRFLTTTEQSAPNRRSGIFGLAVGATCAFSL